MLFIIDLWGRFARNGQLRRNVIGPSA